MTDNPREPMPAWYVVLRQTADEDGAPDDVRDACRDAADHVDRLRAELAETRAADPLVAAVRALVRDGASAASVGRLAAELTTYRRSVRGDAPDLNATDGGPSDA